MVDDTVQLANITGEVWHPKGSVHRTESHVQGKYKQRCCLFCQDNQDFDLAFISFTEYINKDAIVLFFWP